MNEYRQLFHRIGLIGIAQLLIGLSGIVLLPILTKSLPIEDYGTWVQIVVTLNLISTIVLLGLPFTMVRFLAAVKIRAEILEGFYSITFVVAIIAGLTSFVLFLLADYVASALFNNNVLITQIFCIVLFFECIIGLVINYFRTFQQIKLYSFFLIFRTCLQLLLVGFFVLSGYEIFGAIVGLLITDIVLFLTMAMKIFLEIGIAIPKFLHLREYLSFCLPTVPQTLSSWVVDSGDRYFIGILLGNAFVGYYSPAYALGSLIMVLSAPLLVMLPPVLSKYYDEKDEEDIKKTLTYSFKYYLLLAIPAVVGLSLLSKSLLLLLTTPEIALNGYMITPFIAASTLFLGLYLILVQILLLVKKTVITGKIWIFAALLNFGLNMVLIPWIGLLGAAIATLIAFFLVFILTYYYSFKYITFDLQSIFILKCVVSSLVMGIVIIILGDHFNQSLIYMMLLVIISSLLYGIIIFILGGFKKEEIIFFKTILSGFNSKQ